MGQKTSPISTRLYGNCWPNSCWYSDSNTFSLFYQDLNQKQFFDRVMPPAGRKFGLRPARVVCHQFPKKSYIHLFFLRRNKRLKVLGKKRRRVFRFAKNLNKKTTRFQSKGLRMPINKRFSAIDVVAIHQLYTQKNRLLTKPILLTNYTKQLRKRFFFNNINALKKGSQLAATTLGFFSNTTRYNSLGSSYKDTDSKRVSIFDPKKREKQHSSLVRTSNLKSIGLKQLPQSIQSLRVKTKSPPSGSGTQPGTLVPLMKEVRDASLSKSLLNGGRSWGETTSSLVTSSSLASKRPYNTHMSELAGLTSGSITLIVPLSLNSMMVTASLIATHIRALLQQNKRFKSICKWLFKDIKKYEAIKGVRISCSGRLNGKAIARTDLRKMGETSLHTLKKKIDYAQSMAITRHGVLGIKVWVSYSFNGDEKALDKKEKAPPKRSVARSASITRAST